MPVGASIDSHKHAADLGIRTGQVEQVVALLDAGNTIPFITRYRKEQTGGLDEEQIRRIQESVHTERQLAERAGTILRLIEAQGQLTPELRQAIEQANSLKRLEDLYLPYRPKRKSRAMLARQRGLDEPAERIWQKDSSIGSVEAFAARFVDPEKELSTTADVLRGLMDILAERISENADVREVARRIAWKTGRLKVGEAKKEVPDAQIYRDYFDFSESVQSLPPHRVLAINRGESAGVLRVRLIWDPDRALHGILRQLDRGADPHAAFINDCVVDAMQRFLLPGMEREVRRELTERAERHAVEVFARNLRNLLLQPPLRQQRVVAIDPGLRTGCKLAALDEKGNCIATDLIFVTGSAEKRQAAAGKLCDFLTEHGISLVAIGNGTACRETEELISEIIRDRLPELKYQIINESGASIYSTSPIAREEFPDYDATVRGTISIGRRLQDPLSELVKIDPQHIGVGMYQHDINAKRLADSLAEVIESCVNYVGVELNTASTSLLKHVSGLNQLLARRIVEYREQHNGFSTRQDLLNVPGMGEARFTQAAGFLRLTDSAEPLDATWIHPESYPAARRVLERAGIQPDALTASEPVGQQLSEQLQQIDVSQWAGDLGVGQQTLRDILEALGRPGRDPRSDLPGPVFKQGILKLSELAVGMELTGRVLNVVDFGAFVDIGLKDSGLVHISQLSRDFVRNPHDVVAVGDIVTAWVHAVDTERKRVSLTMIKP